MCNAEIPWIDAFLTVSLGELTKKILKPHQPKCYFEAQYEFPEIFFIRFNDRSRNFHRKTYYMNI